MKIHKTEKKAVNGDNRMSTDLEKMIEGIENTSIAQVITKVDEIYSQISQAQNEWIKGATVFECPSVCGKCCEIFEPDLNEAEAIYLAAWLQVFQRERAEEFSKTDSIESIPKYKDACPLQKEEMKEHCSVYGGRALICRLFGYCGDTDQNNNPSFRPCKFHPSCEHRTYSEKELCENYKGIPPLMKTFGDQLVSIIPDAAGTTEPLRKALPKALRKLTMIKQFSVSCQK